jgi:hypothetical protein
MGTKISQMTLTGSAPATSEVAIAYNGENYKINPSNLVSSSDNYQGGGPLVFASGITLGYMNTTVTDNGIGYEVPSGVKTVVVVGFPARPLYKSTGNLPISTHWPKPVPGLYWGLPTGSSASGAPFDNQIHNLTTDSAFQGAAAPMSLQLIFSGTP